MLGYLRSDRPGALERPEDGWYDTGDIVSVDADGYIRILGRAKRFAKIAGEMVSLGAGENLVSALWPEAMHEGVGLPGPRKGGARVLVTARVGASGDAPSARATAPRARQPTGPTPDP